MQVGGVRIEQVAGDVLVDGVRIEQVAGDVLVGGVRIEQVAGNVLIGGLTQQHPPGTSIETFAACQLRCVDSVGIPSERCQVSVIGQRRPPL